MLVRKLAVLVAVLAVAPAAYADFTSDLYFGDVQGDPILDMTVAPGATVELTLWDMQAFNDPPGPGSWIDTIYLDFSAADPALHIAGGAMWAWSPEIQAALNFVADDDLSDHIVTRVASPGAKWEPGPGLIQIGTITLTAPMDPGTYQLVLHHTSGPGGGGMGSGTSITGTNIIVPEPMTLALVGLGGVALALRRKR